MQFPIAYWWSRENDKKITLGLDKISLSGTVSLFEAQPCVEKVILLDGITTHSKGGQPWNFGFKKEDYEKWDGVVHLGFHFLPNRQLTMFVRDKFPFIEVDDEKLSETPSIVHGCISYQNPFNPKRRVVLHGQQRCPHTRRPPKFWKVLEQIAPFLDDFEEKVFVGLASDRPTTKPDGWTEFDDGGNWLKLANFINDSALVIGCGSSIVALAGAMKVPSIRIHDKIEGMDYRIFSNLGQNQLNLDDPEEGYVNAVDKFIKEHVRPRSEISLTPSL